MKTLQKEVIAINTETIKLVQLLKISNYFPTGGQAKVLITEGEILVNGEIETRIRKQLQPGDVVEIAGQVVIEVVRE